MHPYAKEKNPTDTNVQKYKKVQKELKHTNKNNYNIFKSNHTIRNSVEDKQYQLAWQSVNEVSGKKSTSKSKLKAASQGE